MYGISCEGGEPLVLLTVAYEGAAKKKRQLAPLIAFIKKTSVFKVIHKVIEVPTYLVECQRYGGNPLEGSLFYHVATTKDMTPTKAREVNSKPYTPGLHLWLASIAVNDLFWRRRRGLPHHNPPQAFFGFKYEGAVWDAHERGGVPKNDTSPEFIDALNKLMEVSVESPRVLFRAPFLDQRLDRFHTVALCYQFGIPVELTSSCTNGWKRDCGHCSQCAIRNQAILAYKDLPNAKR